MQRTPATISWPALGMAVAMALALTTGVPALMQHSGGSAFAPHVEAGARGPDTAVELAGEPIRIEVIGVRGHEAPQGWLSSLTHHAG